MELHIEAFESKSQAERKGKEFLSRLRGVRSARTHKLLLIKGKKWYPLQRAKIKVSGKSTNPNAIQFKHQYTQTSKYLLLFALFLPVSTVVSLPLTLRSLNAILSCG